MKLYGGIEAGGTKFVCAVGMDTGELIAQTRFPTTAPNETMAQAIAFFQSQRRPVDSVGIGAFGPVDLDPSSATFGYITSTPKSGWRNTDVVGHIRSALGVPVGFDTDVNTAALGEYRWGAAQGLETFIYLTIGTGIGGGGLINGCLMHGLTHPEMGHIRLPHDPQTDPFPGICPYHGDCFEGLASGPSMEKRWGRRADTLPIDHSAWALEAHYIAVALSNYVCTLSPQRIVLGGGVMKQNHLFALIRAEVLSLLNGYVKSPILLNQIESYIVPPTLGDRAGVLGAIALAEQAHGS